MIDAEFLRAVQGEHPDPHQVLGPHRQANGSFAVGVWIPGAASVRALLDGVSGDEKIEGKPFETPGSFAVEVGGSSIDKIAPVYRLEITNSDGATAIIDDPYRFWPTLGDVDLHLIGEGRHQRLWEVLGSHVRTHEDVTGTSFSVWAPSARSVRVVGTFNDWDGRRHAMRALGGSGVWELFLPGVGAGAHYKFEILSQDRHLSLKADPMARAAELPPGNASVVAESDYRWHDDAWLAHRLQAPVLAAPMSVYEVHLGSWRLGLNYAELAQQLGDHVVDLGFTHVELLPVAEHPFGGSWGYQVTSYYAPTARFGTPDDFRAFVDALHQRGIGVIVDWVPAHFPRDAWALARFDGSALYEHADPRQGEHPDWGTLVFNYGRNEVRNFLVANALYWVEEFHIDGLRVDAVASMLYLDYSRNEGEWIPNIYGGRENIEAIALLHELNTVLHGSHPGVLTIAEESTAWPGVSRTVHLGGLGFSHKWNMGWMHDTLDYFHHDPVHRRYHHHQLTFGLLYAFTENFVLPLSHDEVVHGKGSLLAKMPGDRWQQLANLRALYGWMWAHPGKQLLFMGSELAQEREWSHERSLDWGLLDDPDHAGVAELVRALNATARVEPALWERDFDESGFVWIDANDSDQSVYAFLRSSADAGRGVVCVANLTPVPREGYRLGLPWGGRWEVILDTNATFFGGTGHGGTAGVEAQEVAWHAMSHSAAMTLPPLAVVWLSSKGGKGGEGGKETFPPLDPPID